MESINEYVLWNAVVSFQQNTFHTIIYPVLYRFGVIEVPEKDADKMEF